MASFCERVAAAAARRPSREGAVRRRSRYDDTLRIVISVKVSGGRGAQGARGADAMPQAGRAAERATGAARRGLRRAPRSSPPRAPNICAMRKPNQLIPARRSAHSKLKHETLSLASMLADLNRAEECSVVARIFLIVARNARFYLPT